MGRNFFLAAVPSGLLLHSVLPPSAQGPLATHPLLALQRHPRGSCCSPVPLAWWLSPRCVTLRCPCAATRELKDVSWAKGVWACHWEGPAQGQGHVTQQCPHPAGTHTPHSGVTQASAHPFQPQGAPHVPPALLSPLAQVRATLLGLRGAAASQPLGWVNRAACSPSPTSSLVLEKPSELQTPTPSSTAHHEHWSCGNWGRSISRLISRDKSIFQAKQPVLPPPPAQPFPVSQPPKLQLVNESSWECVSPFWSRAARVN